MEHKSRNATVGGCNQQRPKQIRESSLEVLILEGEELRNPGTEVGKAV